MFLIARKGRARPRPLLSNGESSISGNRAGGGHWVWATGQGSALPSHAPCAIVDSAWCGPNGNHPPAPSALISGRMCQQGCCFGKSDEELPPAFDPVIGLSAKLKGPATEVKGSVISGTGSILGDSPVLQVCARRCVHL